MHLKKRQRGQWVGQEKAVSGKETVEGRARGILWNSQGAVLIGGDLIWVWEVLEKMGGWLGETG